MSGDESRRREPPYRGDPFTERARDGLGFRRFEAGEPRLPPALLPYLGRPDSQRPRIMTPMGQPPEPDPRRHMVRTWYGFLPVVILLLVLSRLTGQELGGLVWMAIGALWCRGRYLQMRRAAAGRLWQDLLEWSSITIAADSLIWVNHAYPPDTVFGTLNQPPPLYRLPSTGDPTRDA